MGPGDSKLLCGPTTLIGGKESLFVTKGQYENDVEGLITGINNDPNRQHFGQVPHPLGDQHNQALHMTCLPLALVISRTQSSNAVLRARALPWGLELVRQLHLQ